MQIPVLSRDRPMSKPTITRLFVGATVAFAAGLVLVLAAVWAAVASSTVVTATLVIAGSLAMIAGTVAGVVSWVGALLNTYQLEDKTWFASLLALGLVSCGVLAMVAYVLAGPDGTRRDGQTGGVSSSRQQPRGKVRLSAPGWVDEAVRNARATRREDHHV